MCEFILRNLARHDFDSVPRRIREVPELEVYDATLSTIDPLINVLVNVSGNASSPTRSEINSDNGAAVER